MRRAMSTPLDGAGEGQGEALLDLADGGAPAAAALLVMIAGVATWCGGAAEWTRWVESGK